MNAWDRLRRELDAWGDAGRMATLWWRDDDAVATTPALDRLLALLEGFGVPLTLAAIPATVEEDLPARIEGAPLVTLAQHGWAHRDHAAPAEKKCEFPAGRAPDVCLDELAQGRRRLEGLFGDRFRPVLVPPWNRFAAGLAPHLAGAGFIGLSGFGPRPNPWAAPGLVWANCHVDPVDWHGGRGFLGEAATLDRLSGHLAARHAGRAETAEPTGLLSHHLVTDDTSWRFFDRLLATTVAHPAVRWLDIGQVLGAGR